MSFILRRLVFYLVAAWVALTVNFFIPRAIPGNAVQSIMSKFPNLQPSAYRALEAMLGMGHPGSIWNQYGSYIIDVFHLNFDTDVSQYPAQVSTLLGETIPWTLTLRRNGSSTTRRTTLAGRPSRTPTKPVSRLDRTTVPAPAPTK
jgi:peptide/nickel transport system permease protein